jgi:tetratricopeptide (TPR) repeat protein
MGAVYEAVDTKLGERRALKFSKAGHASRINPEARATLRVNHPNVCRAFEIHTAETPDGPVDFISMEYVEGQTLAHRWRRAPIPHPEAVDIALQIARGVRAAHDAGVLHLDLKSANIMLAPGPNNAPRVVVMDFGLAQAFGAPAAPHTIAGTPPYIAPELYQGAAPSPACDLYALGVVLFEMLTGHRPASPPVAPSKSGGRPVDPRWDPIVLACLQPDPARRTPSAAALEDALLRAFTPSSRRRWLIAAAASLTLAASAWAFRDKLFPEPPFARLAILPLEGSTGDPALDETLRGGLAELSDRLDSLGAASRRLIISRPDEASRYQVRTPADAAGRLGASHVLRASVKGSPTTVSLHAEVTALPSGETLRRFDADFPAASLAGLSTSLAGVVTSAFRLPQALPASVNSAAYPFYAAAIGLLDKDRFSFDRALQQLDSAAAADPASPLIPAARSRAWLQKFRASKDPAALQHAASAARDAERLHPDSPVVLLALGELAAEQGSADAAIAAFERAAALEPARAETWHRLGLALARLGRDDDAVRALRKAIELAPGSFTYHHSLGAIHFQKGRLPEAIAEFQTVTRLAPSQPEGFHTLGGALIVAERDREGEQSLRRALSLRETRTGLNNLGVALRYQGKDAEAADLFARSVKLDPTGIPAHLNLANTLRKLGRAPAAREHLDRAATLARAALLKDPRDATARAQLAFTQAVAGNPEAALDNALQASRLDPKGYAVLFWVTMTLDTLGKRDLALSLLAPATPQQLRDLRRQPDLQAFFLTQTTPGMR